MKKLEDAKRRFGVLEGNNPVTIAGDEFASRHFITADTGSVKQLQARNLRLKMEVNRLNEMLNERDELIDQMRNPKPFKWVAAAILVGLVFFAHYKGFM